MNKLLTAGIALGLLAGILCVAQDAPRSPETSEHPAAKPKKGKAPTGTLTGTVYCADTNLPARRAQIYVLQYSQSEFSQRSEATTDLEGRFAVNAIREGDYYVVAVLHGYVNLLSSLTKSHLDAMTDQERKRMLGEIPSVTIAANQPAQASIRLERGTGIEGTVLYDDGSPAIGLQINLALKTRESGKSTLSSMMGESRAASQQNTTDDRGHFRILGVPPGEYLVSVSVPTQAAEQRMENPFLAMMTDAVSTMDVYVGGGFRASRAETIKVDEGGASRDADITIPLSKLHTIRGQVVLRSSGQPPPSAEVELLYADTREPARVAIAPDGIFEIHYVPEGNFILRAGASRAALPAEDFVDDEDGHGEMGGFQVAFNLEEGPAGNVGVGLNIAPNLPSGEGQGGNEVAIAVTGDLDRVTILVSDPPPGGPARNPAPGIQADSPAGDASPQ
jgi:hypothetical protein